MKINIRLVVSFLGVLSLVIPFAIETKANLPESEIDRVIITNESYDAYKTESSGRFDLGKINENITYDEKLPLETYKIDMNLQFDPEETKATIHKPVKSLMRIAAVEGSTKNFWVVDFRTNKNVSIEAELLYRGKKSEVWVHNNEISSEQAKRMGEEFDNKIYPLITQNFAEESDVDGNGKVSILAYDIQDNFNGFGTYVSGYFYNRDLYKTEHSNNAEIFYIDTYPTMGMDKSNFDVSKAFSTLAHEFQHMVNYNQNVIVEQGKAMDEWLDEAMSLAAERMYSIDSIRNRVYYYETSNSIANGHSLLYWDEHGDVLANYSLSYLFGQYLRVQLNQGDKIFKEILKKDMPTKEALQAVLNENFDNNKSIEEFLSDFRQALLVNEDEGLFGFKGERGLTAFQTPIYSGKLPIQLRGGGSVVVPFEDVEQFERPKDVGESISFRLINQKGTDENIPETPELDPFTENDDTIRGYAVPGSIITVYKDEEIVDTTITDENGRFEIFVGKQLPGTILYITAKDSVSGNESVAAIITVDNSTPPSKPIINEVTNTTTIVTGKADLKSIIKITVGGQEIGSGTVKEDGTFEVDIPAQKAGTVLTLTAIDQAGNISEVTKVTVIDGTITEKSTSRLGHIKAGESFIYPNPPGEVNKKSSEEYKNAVYYIKKEATYKGERYYLLSTLPSAVNGTIGWMKASDVSSHVHAGVDRHRKTFYVKGTGGAGFDTAWGGSENHVYPDLKPYKNELFTVNLTEKVGNNIWYRGMLKGKQTWIHSSFVSEFTDSYVELSTSRLGHIKAGNLPIYSSPFNTADKKSSDSYTNSVYYIKKQATYNKELYYLLSNNPSSTSRTIGWMKASDVSSHPHVGVDRKQRTLYIKGTGGAGFTRAWGGNENHVYSDLKQLKGAEFNVNLTEKVGNNIWYRGMLNGKQTWIHNSYVTELDKIYKEQSTSRLGHIKAGESFLFTTPYNQESAKSSESYKNSVYYIKKQANFNGTLYYLLSTRPSATTGTIGWMKALDVSSHVHKGHDRKQKTFIVKGNGGAGFDTAWGGSNNSVYADLIPLKNAIFHVNLTEKVGNNIWYRGMLNGKQTWIHSSYVKK